MLKRYLLKILFCLGFSVFGTSAFALNFTLEAQKDKNGYDKFYNIAPFINMPYLVDRNGPYQYFLGQVGQNRPSNATVQWVTFDIVTKDLWIPENHVSHLVFGTRTIGDSLSADSYWFKMYGDQFKGIFAGRPGYRQPPHDAIDDKNINCQNTKSSIYWEFRFLNMTPYQSNYIGLPSGTSLANGGPQGYPTGFFIKCSDLPAEGVGDRILQDGVEYSITIHSAPDGMAYWIYPKRSNGTYLPVWYDYIADNSFPAIYGEGIGDFYTSYTLFYPSTYLSGWYVYSRSQNKSGKATMSQVKNNPYASTFVNMQNTNTGIGITVIPENGFSYSQTRPWKITIKNLNSGWF